MKTIYFFFIMSFADSLFAQNPNPQFDIIKKWVIVSGRFGTDSTITFKTYDSIEDNRKLHYSYTFLIDSSISMNNYYPEGGYRNSKELILLKEGSWTKKKSILNVKMEEYYYSDTYLVLDIDYKIVELTKNTLTLKKIKEYTITKRHGGCVE